MLSALAIATMVNAPGILIGYGLVFAIEYYALLAYRPTRSALYFLVAHIVALPILMYTKSIFITVALASVILRTLALYLLGRLKEKLGPLGLALGLAAIEQLLALSVAILYYGDDGIHTGLSIYGIFLAPFTYMIYKYNNIRVSTLASVATTLLLLGYWLSVYAFLVPSLLVATLVGLLVLVFIEKTNKNYAAILSIFLLLLGIALGGAPLKYNAKAALYPFNPNSWSDTRWAQDSSSECPPTLNVFENTHSPSRLRIIETCLTVEGVVKPVPFIAGDGDYCFDLEVNDTSILGIGNLVLRHGALHVEVVPANHFDVLNPTGGVCPGDRVRVTGVFVIDTDHGMWSEVHPVYKIEIVERAGNATWPECIRGIQYEGG